MAKRPRGPNGCMRCEKCRRDFPTYDVEDIVAVTTRTTLEGTSVLFNFAGSTWTMTRQAAEYVAACLLNPSKDPFKAYAKPAGYRHPWERTDDGRCERCYAAFPTPGVFICPTPRCDDELRCRSCRTGHHWDCKPRGCDCTDGRCGERRKQDDGDENQDVDDDQGDEDVPDDEGDEE